MRPHPAHKRRDTDTINHEGGSRGKIILERPMKHQFYTESIAAPK